MINKLRKQIIEANEAYRLGKPLITDSKYDTLIEELSLLSPGDDLLTKVGVTIADESRKVRLDVSMASMNKIKTLEDINNWARLKEININELVVVTPKFDGLSLLVNEHTKDAVTRGDGTIGQKSNDHYKLIQNKLGEGLLYESPFEYTYGEVMMSKKVFMEGYSNDFANPRNLVAGLLNSKEINDSLADCQYIKYGGVGGDFKTKKEILDELNSAQKIQVQYYICKISELTEDLLIRLFHEWSTDFEIDGVIIEVNDLKEQERLGRETSSGNPVFARAFKHSSFEQTAQTEVLGISWNISKQGLLKPILHVRPIKLDGVTVSNVTGNNAKFVKDMGLGAGAIVVVKRSGMVIPLICDIIKSVAFQQPTIEGVEIGWNENKIELITLTETDDQKIKKIISFFEILEADNVGEGVINQLWDAGFKTIKDILNLSILDLQKIDRFGKRKATIVFESIRKSVTNVQLSKVQHATGIFPGLGSKKLILLEHFKTKPTIGEVMTIEGFAETSAKSYINGYDEFFNFIRDLPISIKENDVVDLVSDDLKDMSVVFTGVRRPDLSDIIKSRGGKELSSISKNVSYLVCKDKSSTSSKMQKATDMGIKILSVEDLEKMLYEK